MKRLIPASIKLEIYRTRQFKWVWQHIIWSVSLKCFIPNCNSNKEILKNPWPLPLMKDDVCKTINTRNAMTSTI